MAEEVNGVDMQEFGGDTQAAQPVQRDINFILDVPLEMTVVIGSTRILVQELLQLGQGSVIALDKLAGEQTDIYVNGIPLAKGEVVVIADALHVRVADVLGASQGEEDES